MIGFVRFVDGYDIMNQLLCMKELKTSTRGKDIFEKIIIFFLKTTAYHGVTV